MTEAKVWWQRHFRLSFVIGALDCTQIEIRKPGLHGDQYICRKGYRSINVQATCKTLEQFTSISAGWPAVFTKAECVGIVMPETSCHSMMEQLVFQEIQDTVYRRG
ncbi:hypothetical protein WA026_018164 [Henosepilachna vigintioctopunctata]|uniref:DDE Tnp4 domain-containing protein n=1 Tax=Henosepilachna vigintioctopunctata TaxID=420089 RepID=A0AAW1UPS7_9CUCU